MQDTSIVNGFGNFHEFDGQLGLSIIQCTFIYSTIGTHSQSSHIRVLIGLQQMSAKQLEQPEYTLLK